MKTIRIHILMIILVFLCSSVFQGCSWFKNQGEKTAQELVNEGVKAFNKKRYRQSIESFTTLKDWYPFSKYAIVAELKIADAYYNLKEYEEAVFAYEEFESLHPRNEATPYVVYQIGKCYFDRMDAPDRDQDTARKALDTFNRMIVQFPESQYTNKAQEHINACIRSLAENELYVGRFYFRSKHFKAALNRFKKIIADYPDVGVHSEALLYIPVCEAEIEKKEAELEKLKIEEENNKIETADS